MSLSKILVLQVLIVVCTGGNVFAGTIPQFFMDSVVAIYTGVPDPATNTVSPIATGFLVRKSKYPKSNKLYLVTNRHVVEKNKPNVKVRFNHKSGGNPQSIDILFEKWTGHPSKGVDVVVTNIEEQKLKESEYSYFSLDKDSLDITQMFKQKITEGDFIYVLGYPMQIVGTQKKEYPVVRSGSIAQLRNVLDDKWGTFFIDAFTFPGNSGGPVILRQEAMHAQDSKPIKNPSLIGIVSGYPPYRENLVNQQTNEVQTILTVNPGLSIVFPVDYISQAIDAAEKKSS